MAIRSFNTGEWIKYRVGTVLLISRIGGLSLALIAKGHQALVSKHRQVLNKIHFNCFILAQ